MSFRDSSAGKESACDAIAVWEEGRGGRRRAGRSLDQGRGEGKPTQTELRQFPRTRNFLPGQAQGLWVPLVVAIEIQPLAAQTDHWGCSFNI